MLLDDSILTEKYFKPVVSGPKVSIYRAHMQPFTTSNSSGHLVLPTAFAHLSPNQSISKQSKSPGDGQAVGMH